MSAWIDHVKKVAKDKKITYREALKVAGKTWKGKDKAAPKKGKKDEKVKDEKAAPKKRGRPKKVKEEDEKKGKK